ncbi:putative choline dehydrogenase [Ustulina deusta]|nr:putative choline dehydrogenase [Ustulina deusta]KAI3328355.1 putative choline dehydrogenase [Ustulina deusta]
MASSKVKPMLALALLLQTVLGYVMPRTSPSTHAFDYVIVGGGTGGLAMASRLSENPNISVAVVEAGTWSEKETGNQSQVPAYDFWYGGKGLNQTNPAADWGFTTTPQAGVGNQVVHYARGKSLGGSSNLNYMNYAHTVKGAFDQWADVVGDKSYEYESVREFYLKSMNFSPAKDTRFANATPIYDESDAATGGPLDVTYAAYSQSWATWVQKAMNAVGIPKREAFLDGSLMGCSWMTLTIDPVSGHRESSATAFLQPVLSRKNLAVFDLTLAKRVVFNKNKAATGVEVEANGATFTLRANKEVILAAGAFQSPQLLQVSGVGPAALLKQHGIPVVADLPGVGQNLQDHVLFGIGHRVSLETYSALQYGNNRVIAEDQFNANQTGMLASSGGDFFAFEKVPADLRAGFSASTKKSLSKYPADWPEVEYVALPQFVGDEEFTDAGSPQDGYMYATLLAVMQTPASVGTVSIRSNSMSDPPVINPAWLTAQQDRDVVVAAFKRARQILGADVLKQVTIGDEYYPGPSVKTDEQILKQMSVQFNTISHPASTCKMGTKKDPMAVVDTKARVFGVQNLRVVDASAFPFLPPGLPQSTVYMLAEKIADSIVNPH